MLSARVRIYVLIFSFWRLGPPDLADELLDGPAGDVVQNLGIESLLVADVVVKGCLVDVSATCDFVHAGASEAYFGKDLLCSGKDARHRLALSCAQFLRHILSLC